MRENQDYNGEKFYRNSKAFGAFYEDKTLRDEVFSASRMINDIIEANRKKLGTSPGKNP